MTNRNMIPLTEEKKQIAFTGYLALPLRVGEKAFISHGSQTFITSTVKTILEVSLDGVVFETCNTIYTIVYALVPLESEVMCA